MILFGFISQIKSQSKKELIQLLSLRVDSLSNTILEERNSNDKQLKYFENLIISLNNEKQKLQEQIKDLKADLKFKGNKLDQNQFSVDSLTELNIKLIRFPKGLIFCNKQPTEVVDIYNPVTGKTWMDRNLGATRAAISPTDKAAYGDLFQWGRAADGHQCRNSAITSTLSSTDQPNHPIFIIYATGSKSVNWRSSQNDNLWQGVSGVNNPCPLGYRIPTKTELESELKSWSETNSTGAFKSPLKLPLSGFREFDKGLSEKVDMVGTYWSSTVDEAKATALYFSNYNDNASRDFLDRLYGLSVRCIKD